MLSMYNNIGAPTLMGCGAINQVGEKAKGLGCTKAFIIHDKNLKELGMVDKIIEKLKEESILYVCFDGVLPDPPDVVVEEAALIAHAEKIDGIIAIGGGSALDTAKAVNVLINNPSPIHQYFVPGVKLKPGVPSILIPTTAGTGSEVTTFTVITNTQEGNAKRSINSPTCVATLAIIDPELTFGMPASLTAATGMDAFAHAAEAITCKFSNPLVDAFCREAIRMIADNLVIAVKDGHNIKSRENMCWASNLAGIAFTNALVHLGHSVGHVLGATYHIPHGVACGLILSPVIRWASSYVPDKVRMIGQAMGCEIPEDASNKEIGNITAEAIQLLTKKIGIPTLKELGLNKEELNSLLPLIRSQGAIVAIPGIISDDELLDILCEAYDR